ncbi:CDP-alcohol phosphatidyltransferase [Penicillium malachiteum]|uniref:CDP-diacylglycerol--serine O-phosphatidyltransferase n=1 Tax=Penicillium malachiteum TaxID=1324776 RepID=A0AAD6MY68_9EURO|nr:CDP-alcohol phosphatidyltransferase [Penicillium malachiteum]
MSRRTSSMASSNSKNGPPSNDGGQERQKMLLGQENGHFSMVKFLRRQVLLFPISNLILTVGAVMSVFSSIRYCLGDPSDVGNVYAAIGLSWLGGWFDLMDGKIARWRKKSSLMGQELDSLADLISFGLAPAVVAFALGLRTNVDHILLTFFVLCGLTRLARFNVTVAMLPKDKTGKSKYFEGTPIPTSLSITMFMAFWAYNGWTHENLPLGVFAEGSLLEFHPIALLFVVQGCLMVSKTLRVPKL